MHIAVVYFGLARRTSATISSIVQNVFAANAGQGLRFTTLASLNLVRELNNLRSREHGLPLDPADALLLDADLYLLQRQDDAAIAEPLSAAQLHPDPYSDDWASVRNLLHQLRSLERAWRLIETLDPAPDRVLFLRPDVQYLDPFPLRALAEACDGTGCIALPAWASHHGFNDRFAFADLVAARTYATRIAQVPAFCRDAPLRSERFLGHVLVEAGCRFMELPVHGQRIRANGLARLENFRRTADLDRVPRRFTPVYGGFAPEAKPPAPEEKQPAPGTSSVLPAIPQPPRAAGRFEAAGRPERVEANGFPRVAPLSGRPYLEMLRALHAERRVERYLEIGVQTGRSLACARPEASIVAVDPALRIDRAGWSRPHRHAFEMTSDAFFAAHDPVALLGGAVELAFLDGMHLAEYLLRDFANSERHAAPDGLIVLHDAVPLNFEMTERQHRGGLRRDRELSRWWTGDVWRVLPVLRRERPDLEIQVLDCPPTGLVLVSNLDPGSTVLQRRMDALVAELAGSEAQEAEFWSFIDGLELVASRSLRPPSWREVVVAEAG